MHRWLRLIRLSLAAWALAAWAMPSVLVLLLFPLGACTPDYPMDKPGTWSLAPGSVNSNDANLRVMVANPHDLVEGTRLDASTGAEAAPPVARLLSGQRYPLPAQNASSIDAVTQQQPQGNNNPRPN